METRRRNKGTCKRSRLEFEFSRIERVLREEERMEQRRWDDARRDVGTLIYDQRGRVYRVCCMKGDFMYLWDIEGNAPKKASLGTFTEKYRVL